MPCLRRGKWTNPWSKVAVNNQSWQPDLWWLFVVATDAIPLQYRDNRCWPLGYHCVRRVLSTLLYKMCLLLSSFGLPLVTLSTVVAPADFSQASFLAAVVAGTVFETPLIRPYVSKHSGSIVGTLPHPLYGAFSWTWKFMYVWRLHTCVQLTGILLGCFHC